LTHGKSAGVLYNLVGAAIGSRPDTKEITAKYDKRFGVGGYFSVAGYYGVCLYALCIHKGVDPSQRLAIGRCFGSLDVPAGRMVFD
jgi:branched-chain amino acid transport system substrate-binding protein